MLAVLFAVGGMLSLAALVGGDETAAGDTSGGDAAPDAPPDGAMLDLAALDPEGDFSDAAPVPEGALPDASSPDPATAPQGENVTARAGDLIHTGDGDDVITGSAGVTLVHSGAGDDLIDFQRSGTSAVLEAGGDAGDDTIAGAEGADFLIGGTGADSIEGGAGNDTIIGGEDRTIRDIGGFVALDDDAPDTIDGGAGDDLILAGSGDIVATGSGQDILRAGGPDAAGDPVTVTDFAADEDLIEIVVPGNTPPDADPADFIRSQVVGDHGVTVSFTNGPVVFFAGATEAIPMEAFRLSFV